MYAHAAAQLCASKAAELDFERPTLAGVLEDTSGCSVEFRKAEPPHEDCGRLSINLRKVPPLSAKAIGRLLQPELEALTRNPVMELALSGRASCDLYARAAWAAVAAGVRRLICWSARDGLVVVYDRDGQGVGEQIARPAWLAAMIPRPMSPVILGVAGDPNSGKSIFCEVLDWQRERSDEEGWKLDSDSQSPTPHWYLSIADQGARTLRERYKCPWTAEMEKMIVDHLRCARELFEVTIADLPGGNHNVDPPQRIPPGRERIFGEVDAFILLDRADKPSEGDWRAALRAHGLEDRIAAVLVSTAPNSPPSLSLRLEGSLWRGTVSGLDRSRAIAALGEIFQKPLEQFWKWLVEFGRARLRKRTLEDKPK